MQTGLVTGTELAWITTLVSTLNPMNNRVPSNVPSSVEIIKRNFAEDSMKVKTSSPTLSSFSLLSQALSGCRPKRQPDLRLPKPTWRLQLDTVGDEWSRADRPTYPQVAPQVAPEDCLAMFVAVLGREGGEDRGGGEGGGDALASWDGARRPPFPRCARRP